MDLSEQLLLVEFSCPAEPFDESLFTAVGVQHVQAVLEIFLSCFRAELTGCVGVTEKLEEIITSEPDFNAVWSPAVSTCFRATSLRNSSLARKAAAEVLLQAAAHGVQGGWEIEFAKPGLFLWDACLLPKCDYLSVNTVGETASVITRGAGAESRVLFRRASDEAAKWVGDGGESLASLSTEDGPVVFLPRGILNPSDLDGFHNDLTPAPEIISPVPAAVEGAFNLLKSSSPVYSKWVSRVIRRVAVAGSAAKNYLQSGMVPRACGLAFMTDRQDVLSQAETLVHEASHNYFYLLSTLGTTVDPASDELYYSPFARVMRGLERVLSSYHAFANVYLFHRDCRDALPDYQQVCTERMSSILEDLRTVEECIKGSKRLTPAGTVLVERLSRELHNQPSVRAPRLPLPG
ncbi:MAG: HEXXH motif-containing putative peptide modification protein [Pyrinomonadaceae bacterium]